MPSRIQRVDQQTVIVLDDSLLQKLRITPETDLEISTDGERLIITPVRAESDRERRFARAQARTIAAHETTFRRLAE